METTPAGSAPVPAPTAEPKVVTSAPAQPDASSLPVPESVKALEGATTRQQLAELTNKLLADAVQKKAQKAPVTEPAPAPKVEATPAPEPKVETPAKVETTTEPAKVADPEAPIDPHAPVDPEAPAPETAPAVDPEKPETEAIDPDEVTPATPGRHRLEITKDDELGLLASAYKRRNRDWTLDQCMDAAKAKLGVKPAATTEPAKPAEDQLPQTLEATNAEIIKLVALKKEAATGLRVDEVVDLDEKINALREHKLDLREGQVRQQSQADTVYRTAFEKSEAQAVETYRFASVPTSPAGKRMVEIEEAMERTGDPRFHDPNKPMIIANLVAAEFKIAPLSKTKKAATAPAAPPPPTPKKGMLPSGASSTAPAAPAVNATADRLSAISTPADLRAAYKAMGLPVPG